MSSEDAAGQTKGRLGSHGVDRRVRKSKEALARSFIALILERGYDAVTIEDITNRADVARATFYAHYTDKEHLLSSLFEEISSELASGLTNVEGAPDSIRTYIVKELYEHAYRYRDLYLVCLRGAGDGRARAAYLDVVAERAEAVFAERFRSTGREPALPLSTLGRAFAGAHVSLLEQWLEVGDVTNLDSAVQHQMKLLTNGFAWALGMLPDDDTMIFPLV